MKKLVLALATVGCLAFVGCGQAKYEAFVKGTDAYASEILPEYEEYVRNDPKLKDESKEIRTRTSSEFRLLIEKGKEDLKK